MKASILSVLALASTAFTQEFDGVTLPADLAEYVGTIQTNTAAIAALEGIFTASQVLDVVQAAPTLGNAALIEDFESAVMAAIAAEPTELQAVATSIFGVVAADAATDGLLGEIATATGLGSAIGSQASVASSAASAMMTSSMAGTGGMTMMTASSAATAGTATPTIMPANAGNRAMEINAALIAAGLAAVAAF